MWKLKQLGAIYGLALCVLCSLPAPCFASSFGWECASYEGDINAAVHRWWPDLRIPKLWEAQLYTESRCNPDAVSPVGAQGIAQFMPRTAEDYARKLGLDPFTSPHVAKFALPAGAAFMADLRRTWSGRSRLPIDAHDLALGSYNAGTGNILSAQRQCNDGLLWSDIAPCLGQITGTSHAKETLGYVVQIHRYWKILEGE